MPGMKRLSVTAALVLGALGLSAATSHAQSSATVVGPPAINKALSTAAVEAKLPLAAPTVFSNAEKAAAMSARQATGVLPSVRRTAAPAD